MKKITIALFAVLTSGLATAQSWTPLTTGTTTNLLGISFADDNTGWSVGSAGKIIATTNGGMTWSSQTSGTTQALYDVAAISTSTAIAVGDASTVRRTTNGGTTWSTVTSPITGDFRVVWFLDAMTGFVGGGNGPSTGVLMKTTDGGATWTGLTPSTGDAVYGIYFTSATVGYITCSGGKGFVTTDGGFTWTAMTMGTTAFFLDDVHFTSPTTGFVSGDGGTLLKTTNAGLSWSTVTIPGSGTNRLLGLHFLNSAVGYVVGGLVGGTNSGIIFKTNDGGTTWTTDHTNTNRFYQCSFPSFGAGYACGINGTIVKVSNINASVDEHAFDFDFGLYPNPSNSIFRVSLHLKEEGNASVKIYDMQGKEILDNNAGHLSAGEHEIEFTDLSIPAGVYLIEVTIGNTTLSKKLMRTE
jgi:photosystem II stability/assembly factor-like uncharacterized protein